MALIHQQWGRVANGSQEYFHGILFYGGANEARSIAGNGSEAGFCVTARLGEPVAGI